MVYDKSDCHATSWSHPRCTLSLYLTVCVLSAATAATHAETRLIPDAPSRCEACAEWNKPQTPFRIFGNTYYVGTAQLSAILIRTKDGLILIDGALPQSAPLIDANIRALGFDTAEVKLIVTSHTHFDHVGGVAALQRATGAMVAASPSSAQALREGRPAQDDPQFASPDNRFPRVVDVTVIADGEALTMGDVAITPHFTPGHTPGGTTWTWRSCEQQRCLNIVYADSLNAVSAEGFLFTTRSGRSPLVDAFRRSIHTIETLPCDILLSPHSGFFGMADKLRRRAEGQSDAFVDATACRRYAAAASARLDQRIAREREMHKRGEAGETTRTRP
ncbi:MAG: subclass B3 metallo-beta-lactamase [Steroidobacteraceae bacterium]|nr:subclass B3 metallo-beta-lactamase [Steroidobacteraceae bacterium]